MILSRSPKAWRVRLEQPAETQAAATTIVVDLPSPLPPGSELRSFVADAVKRRSANPD